MWHASDGRTRHNRTADAKRRKRNSFHQEAKNIQPVDQWNQWSVPKNALEHRERPCGRVGMGTARGR